MNTRNIKTIIAALLAAANIFLIINIAALDMRVKNLPADMIENTAAVLKSRGVEADAKKIPAAKPGDYIYEGVFTDTYDIIKNFTGASDEEIIDGEYIVAGGMAYNVGGYRFSFIELENYTRIEIADSEYWGGGTLRLTEALAGHNNFNRSAGNRAAKIIREFLKKYQGQDKRTGFEITALHGTDAGREEVRINQTADGLLISAHTADILIYGDEVKYFSGRWYFGELSHSHEMPLHDAVNILFKCLEKEGAALEGARLEKMEREYYILKWQASPDYFYLAPSWKLSFYSGTEKEEKIFSYDMYTGVRND